MAKILVVDDEITMIQITSELLRAEGHEVFSSSNLEQACALLEQQKPELLITDLYLEKAKPVGLTLLQKATAMNPPRLTDTRPDAPDRASGSGRRARAPYRPG